MRKTSGRRKRWVFLGLSVLLLALLLVGTLYRSEASLPSEEMVEVKRGNVALAVVATGSIVPASRVEVKSKASGLVKDLLIEEGDLVGERQVLLELDKELLEAQLREAMASLMATRARHREAESEAASATQMKLKLSKDLENLQDKVAYLEKQVNRYSNLFDEKLIPHSELETRERELQDAVFQVEALRSELLMQEARIEAARKAVARMEAEVIQSEAGLDRSRENLRHATLRSPMAGTVLKRHVEVGDAVSSILQLGSQATLLLTLGDMNQVFFEGRVDEADIGKVYVGQRARVRVDAFRDQPFPGEVLRIAPLGEEEDNVVGFEVRVSIEDSASILRAHMSANAEILIDERKEVLILPESAIVYDQNRDTFVNVFDPESPGGSSRVAVKTGISDGTSTEVQQGLEEGDLILKAGRSGLF